jgi:hypothetical protein
VVHRLPTVAAVLSLELVLQDWREQVVDVARVTGRAAGNTSGGEAVDQATGLDEKWLGAGGEGVCLEVQDAAGVAAYVEAEAESWLGVGRWRGSVRSGVGKALLDRGGPGKHSIVGDAEARASGGLAGRRVKDAQAVVREDLDAGLADTGELILTDQARTGKNDLVLTHGQQLQLRVGETIAGRSSQAPHSRLGARQLFMCRSGRPSQYRSVGP